MLKLINKLFILTLLVIVTPVLLYGHNPLAARYHLEAGMQASLLTINLSQDGVNQAFINIYGKEKLDTINQKDFEELIVEYIKNNFLLTLDGQKVHLEKGGIKLGSHQTDLKFVLPPILETTSIIVISIPAFKENKNHQTIFTHNLRQASHQILSSENDFEATMLLSDSPKNNYWVPIFGIVALCLLLMYFFFRKKEVQVTKV